MHCWLLACAIHRNDHNRAVCVQYILNANKYINYYNARNRKDGSDYTIRYLLTLIYHDALENDKLILKTFSRNLCWMCHELLLKTVELLIIMQWWHKKKEIRTESFGEFQNNSSYNYEKEFYWELYEEVYWKFYEEFCKKFYGKLHKESYEKFHKEF